jgi:hypothetical protein
MGTPLGPPEHPPHCSVCPSRTRATPTIRPSRSKARSRPIRMASGARSGASCSARSGEERVQGLTQLLDPVRDRSTGAAQGGRVAGPGRLGTEQQIGIPVAALIALDVGDQPGPRDVLGIPQMHHPRIGQPGGVPAATGVTDLLVDPAGIDPQTGLGWVLRISDCTNLAPRRQPGQVGRRSISGGRFFRCAGRPS